MAVRFHWLMWLGFRIHLFGFFATLMFASRLYFESKKRSVDTCLLVMIAFYTIIWVIWLLSLIVLRFCEFGRVCSGAYLEDELHAAAIGGRPVQVAQSVPAAGVRDDDDGGLFGPRGQAHARLVGAAIRNQIEVSI